MVNRQLTEEERALLGRMVQWHFAASEKPSQETYGNFVKGLTSNLIQREHHYLSTGGKLFYHWLNGMISREACLAIIGDIHEHYDAYRDTAPNMALTQEVLTHIERELAPNLRALKRGEPTHTPGYFVRLHRDILQLNNDSYYDQFLATYYSSKDHYKAQHVSARISGQLETPDDLLRAIRDDIGDQLSAEDREALDILSGEKHLGYYLFRLRTGNLQLTRDEFAELVKTNDKLVFLEENIAAFERNEKPIPDDLKLMIEQIVMAADFNQSMSHAGLDTGGRNTLMDLMIPSRNAHGRRDTSELQRQAARDLGAAETPWDFFKAYTTRHSIKISGRKLKELCPNLPASQADSLMKRKKMNYCGPGHLEVCEALGMSDTDKQNYLATVFVRADDIISSSNINPSAKTKVEKDLAGLSENIRLEEGEQQVGAINALANALIAEREKGKGKS